MTQTDRLSSLYAHEWLAVVLLIGAVLFVSLITQWNPTYKVTHLDAAPQTYDVIVKGAVVHQGVYRIDPEMTMGQLLAICEVCPNSDLRRYKLENKLKKGRVLHIRERKVIRVQVSGAVSNPGIIEVYPGTRFSDLSDKLQFLERADRSILNRKGVLKPNQVIEIPFLRK